jgi:hypothetical protein
VHKFSGAHPLGAHHVAVNSSSGKTAATCGFGGEIILWDLVNLKEFGRIEPPEDDVEECSSYEEEVDDDDAKVDEAENDGDEYPHDDDEEGRIYEPVEQFLLIQLTILNDRPEFTMGYSLVSSR